MSEDNDQFAYRPFSGLMRKRFPAAEQIPKEGVSREDRELFLREMHKAPTPKKQNPPGFLLGDQCDLSSFAMKKKKSSPRPVPTPPVKEDNNTTDNSTTDDKALFDVAMRNIQPLGGKGRRVVPARKQVKAVWELVPEEESFATQVEFALNYSDEYMEGFVVGLDEIILNRLRLGQFSPEAHLDLHGLNTEQALEALKDFMRQAWFKGLRTVLLVPGRGRNSPAGMGILRQKLPYWLSHEPFKRLVLAFCTAQPHDGGPGSVYALLRKARKKGPVRWETLAFDSDIF